MIVDLENRLNFLHLFFVSVFYYLTVGNSLYSIYAFLVKALIFRKMSNVTQVMRCISLTRLLSNSTQKRPNNEKVLDRCVLAKKRQWLYLSIMQHLVSWTHSGECSRAMESLSDCVRVCQGWCDFVTEYWTSLRSETEDDMCNDIRRSDERGRGGSISVVKI